MIRALETEKSAELRELVSSLNREFRPRSALERIYVGDITAITWEMERLSQAKAELIKGSFPQAVASLIKKLSPTVNLSDTGLGEAPDWPRQEVALDWISDSGARKKVAHFLSRFNLDEKAIEAEAVLLCVTTLERLEQMLGSLDRRRTRAVFNLFWHRENFGDRKRDVDADADRVQTLTRVPRLSRM